ncbi:penicillin-binding protein 1C [Bacteroides nordii]|uniref:peptidoglycan glycosyltransferase n=1 Tax=Bacteroides nordii CL02T12C05 TaxID=997884 RepID=I9S8X2_9BACE|nr:penicillin-binding protein 1C [Bacteroides nordii]EIY52231.1 penicillin-binding protein 1C [Bacteroides nordii CL02T12C05]MCG4768604.1 penicillin-binding protein 1C [Bacteroides nordii]
MIGGGIITLLLIGYIFCLPRQLFHVPYSTVVTDRNNELLGARIAPDGQWRFPPRTTTPAKIQACFIEFEDNHFFHHWGVNPVSIGRAAYQNLKAGRVISGGSTITMQTIRLARNNPRTFSEKFIEMIWATRLEFRYSKEKILSLYVSHAPFGGNVVGLDAAAWRYFGHSADDLSWAEAAMLAVLPNSPAMIHLSKSRQALLDKRNRLLTRLHTKGVLDDSSYELALSEPLPQEPKPLPQIAPHLTDYFYQTRNGNYSVSTIDRGIQLQIEELIERWNGEFSRSDIRNIAILVIDVQKNQPIAYCGNVHFNKTNSGNQVDIIRSPRSTGSILKPFLYYAMLQEGSILPHTLLPDIPININGFAPQNFSQQFEGAVPASEALARSLNIPTVTMLQRYGVPKFYNFLKQTGISTLTRPASHYGLSLILGGAEGTLWDITCAYTDMARCLKGLDKTDCSLLLSDSAHNASSVVPTSSFSPCAVWQTFEAIKEVNRPEEIDWRTIPSMQTIAWKTGTSYGFRDAWAVGVTPRYAVGVWVGNATGEGKPGLVGARTAGPVMFDVFNLLPSSPWFVRPSEGFVDAEVCHLSGHLKGRFCEETDTILILPAGLKTEACPYHHRINLSADGTQRIYESCINTEATIQKNWFTLPPVWEWYYKQRHPEYKTLPPFKPGCGEDILRPMQFVYPTMNARIFLPRQMDGSKSQLTFELVHSVPKATVYWHLDNNYLAETQDFHKISLLPSSGKHTMTAVDNEGNTVSVTFFVE